MSRTVSIAACNFAVKPIASFDEFADHVRRLLDQASGAQLVLLPELFTVELFTTYGDWREAPIAELTRVAEHTDSYRALFAEEARERQQHIVAGSHLVLENGRYLNVGHLFEPSGEFHAHAKTHIFPAEADWSTEEGTELETIDLDFAKVGFNICYEAEIPECAATLAEQGAEIILCPSFTFTEYGFWRVRHCAAARAIENQVYFVHCCCGGSPGEPLPNGWAQSSILSPCDQLWTPRGIVAEAPANEEVVIRGEVDMDKLYENRERGAAPTYRDRRRRADLYGRWPSHINAIAT
ncbi:MAG: carbon-nitrogen hydrolase family protein [Solirubrobacteraceae bacterium]